MTLKNKFTKDYVLHTYEIVYQVFNTWQSLRINKLSDLQFDMNVALTFWNFIELTDRDIEWAYVNYLMYKAIQKNITLMEFDNTLTVILTRIKSIKGGIDD